MSNYKKADADQLNTGLASLADVIRSKTGKTKAMDFLAGDFQTEVQSIPTIRKEGGILDLTNGDVIPTSGNTLTQHIGCPNGAKIFVIEPDAATEANIRARTDKNYTLWFRGILVGTQDDDMDGLMMAYMGAYKQVGYAGQTITNTNGIDFTCFTLAQGIWNWTAYYWDE